MSAFQLLRCNIALGGDQGNTVYRDRTRPIVFPELPILQFMHGEEAVTEIHVVGVWDTTNDEVLQRLATIYAQETVAAVFPGARPRLPPGDPSIPRCTLPLYKPKSSLPQNPDPKLRPLDQFTQTADMPVLEAPDLPPEDEPTIDEIASHAQDDDDEEEVVSFDDDDPTMPRPGDLPRVVRDTTGRGSSRSALASRTPSHLPDVNAGGSHSPTHAATVRSRAPTAAAEARK